MKPAEGFHVPSQAQESQELPVAPALNDAMATNVVSACGGSTTCISEDQQTTRPD